MFKQKQTTIEPVGTPLLRAHFNNAPTDSGCSAVNFYATLVHAVAAAGSRFDSVVCFAGFCISRESETNATGGA